MNDAGGDIDAVRVRLAGELRALWRRIGEAIDCIDQGDSPADVRALEERVGVVWDCAEALVDASRDASYALVPEAGL